MFQEFPKWVGVNDLGQDLIAFSAEEETRLRAVRVESTITERTPDLPESSDSAPRKRGRPRRVQTQ